MEQTVFKGKLRILSDGNIFLKQYLILVEVGKVFLYIVIGNLTWKAIWQHVLRTIKDSYC